MEKETTYVRNKHKNAVFIHKIDFNLLDLQWHQRAIVGYSYQRHIEPADTSNQSGRRFVTQIIDFKTRNNTLYLMITSQPSLVNR